MDKIYTLSDINKYYGNIILNNETKKYELIINGELWIKN